LSWIMHKNSSFKPFIHFIVSIGKSINNWTLDSACQVGIHNLCMPLFPCGRN
jgi:hypothetical protein